MENFKIGDKVKLKDDLIVGNRYGGARLYPGMKQWFDERNTAVVAEAKNDDNQIYELHFGKYYSERPGIYIKIN